MGSKQSTSVDEVHEAIDELAKISKKYKPDKMDYIQDRKIIKLFETFFYVVCFEKVTKENLKYYIHKHIIKYINFHNIDNYDVKDYVNKNTELLAILLDTYYFHKLSRSD